MIHAQQMCARLLPQSAPKLVPTGISSDDSTFLITDACDEQTGLNNRKSISMAHALIGELTPTLTSLLFRMATLSALKALSMLGLLSVYSVFGSLFVSILPVLQSQPHHPERCPPRPPTQHSSSQSSTLALHLQLLIRPIIFPNISHSLKRPGGDMG